MGKKATKASRKYAASGQLKKEIQSRKKHQQIKRNIERRKPGGRKPGAESKEAAVKGKGAKRKAGEDDGEGVDEDGVAPSGSDGEASESGK